jgi:hypothetical protein
MVCCRKLKIAGSFIIFIIVLVSFFTCDADAALYGGAELKYTKYHAEVGGTKLVDSSSFNQHYSLIYENMGQLANGRVGAYKYSIGYDWTSFSTKITEPTTSTDIKMSSGKFFYSGNLLVQPQNFPARIEMFSDDLSRSVPLKDTIEPLNDRTSIITPGIYTDIVRGVNRTSGVTLSLGSQKSIYKNFPMLLVDYRETINQNLSGTALYDTRTRDLAFVSLNMKDNWLHFRTTIYDDYLNPADNYYSDRFILGTVDQYLVRKWVEFTNWISISADGQYTRRWDGEKKGNPAEMFDMNLFGIASRQRWNLRTFNSFSRSMDQNTLTYTTRIPIYASGVWGQETDWRFHISNTDSKTLQLSSRSNSSDFSTSYQIQTFKRSLFNLTQSASFSQQQSTNNVKASTVGAHIETASTTKLSSKYTFAASYDIASKTREEGINSNRSLAQTINGRVTYNPNEKLRVVLDENIIISTGSQTDMSPLQIGDATISSPRNGYSRFQTNLRADWKPVARLNIAFLLTEDFISPENNSSSHAGRYSVNLDYTSGSILTRLNSSYSRLSYNGTNQNTFTGSGTVSYTPNRNMDASISSSYSEGIDTLSGIKTVSATVKQQMNAYLYSKNGLSRRIVEASEIAEYEYNNFDTKEFKSKSYGLLMSYYPLSKLFVSGNVKYSLSEPSNSKMLTYGCSLGINYDRLQGSLAYSYGKELGTGTRMERKFEATVRRPF